MTLTERWQQLWPRLGARGDANELLRELMARYGESHRVYHIMTHIHHCLTELDDVLDQCTIPEAVQLGLWYHDAIYDPTRHDNESASMTLLQEHATRYLFRAEVVETALALIATTTHASPGNTGDERIIMDVDLAILGQPEEVFDAYDSAIRQEYSFVPEDAYTRGRTEVLRSFLTRPAIYTTRHFASRYEQQARLNLARAIRRLKASKKQ